MEETIVLSSSELVEYTVLDKQKKELVFKKDFLLSKGLTENDEAIIALNKEIEQTSKKLSVLEDKIKKLDLVLIRPNKVEIDSLSAEISHYSKAALEQALKSKSGPIYELLEKRAFFSKTNFSNRETIARITILANMLPKKESEKLAAILEANIVDVVDVSSLSEEYQKELIKNLSRLKVFASISNNLLSIKRDKPSEEEISKKLFEFEPQVQKKFPDSNNLVWISKENEKQWDELQKSFVEISNQLQIFLTKSQVEKLSEEEIQKFDELQTKYLEIKRTLSSLCLEDQEELKISFSKPLPKPNPPASPVS
ncbi:MAG: hypothetical protein ACK4J0_01255 [Candidatus Anstonellaceae archaeon]